MPQFETPEDATAKLGGVFQDAVTDETLYRGFQQLNAVVRLQLKDPSAQITVKAKKGEPGVVELGPSKLNPDVIVRMDADTAHGWLSGEVNPTVALSKGQMRATGPVDAILRLVPVAPALAEQYRAVLENGGRVTEEPIAEAAPEPAPVASEVTTEEAPATEETTEAAPAAEEVVEGAPAAEEVVSDAPEPRAPAQDAAPAVAEAPQGEPEAVDAIGGGEAAAVPEAAAEPVVEEPAIAAEPAVEEPTVVKEPATEAATTEPPADDAPSADAPADESETAEPADEAPGA